MSSLIQAIDTLKAWHGRNTIVYGSTGQSRAWKLRSDQLSPGFTTDCAELLRV